MDYHLKQYGTEHTWKKKLKKNNRVLINYIIHRAGKLTKLVNLQQAPHELLADHARDAVQAWRRRRTLRDKLDQYRCVSKSGQLPNILIYFDREDKWKWESTTESVRMG